MLFNLLFVIQQTVNEIHFTPRESVVRQKNVSFWTKLDDLRTSSDICYVRMTDIVRALAIYGHRANLLNNNLEYSGIAIPSSRQRNDYSVCGIMDHGGHIDGRCTLAFVKEFLEELVSNEQDYDDDFLILFLSACLTSQLRKAVCKVEYAETVLQRCSVSVFFGVIFVCLRKLLNSLLLPFLSESSFSLPRATAIVGRSFLKTRECQDQVTSLFRIIPNIGSRMLGIHSMYSGIGIKCVPKSDRKNW